MQENRLENKVFTDALSNSKIFADALFSRPESLTKYLPYNEYMKDEKIFLLKDGSLGAIFRLKLVEHEPLGADEITRSIKDLSGWFNLPDNCVLQVLYEQSYLSPRDRTWDNLKNYFENPHPVSKALFNARIEQFQKLKHLDTSKYRPLKRETLVSIRFFPNGFKKAGTIKSFLKRDEFILFKETQNFIKSLKHFSSIIKDFEENSMHDIKQIDASELIDFLRKSFNPKTYYKRDFASINYNESLSNQFLYNGPILDYKGIEREGFKSRVLSLKCSPSQAYAGAAALFTRLKFPFSLSYNFSFPKKEKINNFLNFKKFLLDKTKSSKGLIQLAEIKNTEDALARGDRCVFLTLNVIINAEDEDTLDERVRKIANIFNSELECEVIEEDEIGLGLFLNSLPLNYTPKTDLSAQRYIRILQSDAQCFLPIYDSFRGLDKLNQLYLSRENNLLGFSLTANQTSNHTVVCSDTGSGKSAFILDLMQGCKKQDPEPLVFYIEKKASSAFCAEYFDGDVTIFEHDKEIPFSPFRGIYDETKIKFLTQLLSTAIKLTSPSFQVESEHISAITSALKYAYLSRLEKEGIVYLDGDFVELSDKKEVEITIEDFIEQLASLTSQPEFEKLGDRIEEILHKLKPFYGDGIYAKYFANTSKTKKNSNNKFFVYDLDALDSDETLQALMTMSVIEEIRQTIKLPENEGRGGFIVIEELGMLGRNNPQASAFVIDAAETFRKLGYWLVGITPNPRNYLELEVGRAMLAAADNFIFLSMKRDNVSYFLKETEILDETTAQIVASLKTVSGEYADVFYTNKDKTKQGAFRYFQTPIDRWLCPSNLKDNAAAKKALREFGGDKDKALKYLAETYPQGVA